MMLFESKNISNTIKSSNAVLCLYWRFWQNFKTFFKALESVESDLPDPPPPL